MYRMLWSLGSLSPWPSCIKGSVPRLMQLAKSDFFPRVYKPQQGVDIVFSPSHSVSGAGFEASSLFMWHIRPSGTRMPPSSRSRLFSFRLLYPTLPCMNTKWLQKVCMWLCKDIAPIQTQRYSWLIIYLDTKLHVCKHSSTPRFLQLCWKGKLLLPNVSSRKVNYGIYFKLSPFPALYAVEDNVWGGGFWQELWMNVDSFFYKIEPADGHVQVGFLKVVP